MSWWREETQWQQGEASWNYGPEVEALRTAVRDLETQVEAMQRRLSRLELENSGTSSSSGLLPNHGAVAPALVVAPGTVSEPHAAQRSTDAQSLADDASEQRQEARHGPMLCDWHTEEHTVEEALRFTLNAPE